MTKVKFFGSVALNVLEAEINDWMSEQNIDPSDLMVCQTESRSGWTVSVWWYFEPNKKSPLAYTEAEGLDKRG